MALYSDAAKVPIPWLGRGTPTGAPLVTPGLPDALPHSMLIKPYPKKHLTTSYWPSLKLHL